MPNWCANKLFISGPEKGLAAFLDKARVTEGTLRLSKLVPMTGGIRDLAEEIHFEEEECPKEGHTMISIEDATAYGPPRECLGALALVYPMIRFICIYAEPLQGLYGKYELFNNTILDEGMTKLDYSEQFDEDYKEFKKRVKGMSSGRLLKAYAGRNLLEKMHDQELYADIVAEALLKKVHTNDLPLLVSTVWPSDRFRERFISRVSNSN